MEDKFMRLLKDRPVRHLIVRIETAAKALEDQLTRLDNLDIVNYFVLAKVDRINQVLAAANKKKFMIRKYSWYAITKVTPKTC